MGHFQKMSNFEIAKNIKSYLFKQPSTLANQNKQFFKNNILKDAILMMSNKNILKHFLIGGTIFCLSCYHFQKKFWVIKKRFR